MKYLKSEIVKSNFFEHNGTVYQRIEYTVVNEKNESRLKDVIWKNSTGKKTVNSVKSKELKTAFNVLRKPVVSKKSNASNVQPTKIQPINYLKSPAINSVKFPEYPSQFKNIDRDIMSLHKQGRMIEAVKKFKEYSGYGLKESKDYCDTLVEKFRNRISR